MNLKKAKGTDGELGTKQGLIRILEFCAGDVRTLALKGRFRCLLQVLVHIAKQSQMRGRRGMSIRLPPNWPQEGLLGIEKAEKRVWR